MSDGKAKRGTREGTRDAAPEPQSNERESVAALPAAAEPIVSVASEASLPSAGTEPVVSSLRREATFPEPIARSATMQPVDLAETAWVTLAEAQRALARGWQETAAEMAGVTQSNVSAGSEAAIALLGARTFADIVKINATLAQRSVGSLLQCSARMGEISGRAGSDAARLFLAQLGSSWPAVPLS